MLVHVLSSARILQQLESSYSLGTLLHSHLSIDPPGHSALHMLHAQFLLGIFFEADVSSLVATTSPPRGSHLGASNRQFQICECVHGTQVIPGDVEEVLARINLRSCL